MKEPIDFVVTWLDSSDTIWQKKYAEYKGEGDNADKSESRYREWDLFKYWFRAVETFAPWVNKVFLITNGTFPDWINVNHPKLVLVKHSDYIPKRFLPTFNSCTIELHMSKIPGLSEHFVYFNDDCYINAPISKDYYFKRGLPCDSNEESFMNVPTYSKEYKYGIFPSMLTNIAVINAHFERWPTVRHSMKRWFGPHLSWRGFILSILLIRQRRFIGFNWRHFEQPFLKSMLDDAWSKASENLENSCTRFREEIILNPYFFRYWQFATNNFYPVKLNHGINIRIRTDNKDVISQTLKDSKIKSLCLNDTPYCSHEEYIELKTFIQSEFGKKFPLKSSFEK